MAARRRTLLPILLCLPLLPGCQFNPTIETETLSEAAAIGDTDYAQFRLDRGDSPVTYDCEGYTPLHLAVLNNQPAAVTLLVDRGANVNALNYAGQTPLHLAAAVDNPQMLQFLLSHKADVAAQDNHGNTPLHVAARRNRMLDAGLLLDAGASPATRNLAGLTPLAIAVADDNTAVVELFRKRGIQQ